MQRAFLQSVHCLEQFPLNKIRIVTFASYYYSLLRISIFDPVVHGYRAKAMTVGIIILTVHINATRTTQALNSPLWPVLFLQERAMS